MRVQRPESVASRVEGCAEWVYSPCRSSALALNKDLFKERALFFYNALVDFTAPAIRLCIYTSLCAYPQPFRPHTTHARFYFYDLHCGQKAHRGIRNKMHISQKAQGTNRAARGPSVCGQRVEPASGHFSLPVMSKCCRTLA